MRLARQRVAKMAKPMGTTTTAGPGNTRRGMENLLGIARPEEKLQRILNAILNKELQLDNVFIASEHQGFLRRREETTTQMRHCMP